MQRFRVAYLGLAMPNQCSQTVRKANINWGDNFGPKSPNLYDSYIAIVLPYYMISLNQFSLDGCFLKVE